MYTYSLNSFTKWSWKESVCVATLLVALIPAVLSVLYGDLLLYLWLLWLCLGCMGDILHGLHGELSSSVLHGDLSSFHGGLPGLLGSHGLHGGLSSSSPHGDLSSVHGGLPCAAGGPWGCLFTGCLALYYWGWISSIVQVLLIMSPSPRLWLISFLKQNLEHLLVPCHNLLFLSLDPIFKGLERNLFVCFPDFDLFLKGLEMNLTFTCVLYGLERNSISHLCQWSWKKVPYWPDVPCLGRKPFSFLDLPMVLKKVFLPLFLSVSLTLLASSFSLTTLVLSTPGVLKGVNLCSVLLSPALSVFGWVLKGVSVHISPMTLMPSTPRVLKEVNLYLFCSLLSCVLIQYSLANCQYLVATVSISGHWFGKKKSGYF